jgi:tyrosine-specific transport protein
MTAAQPASKIPFGKAFGATLLLSGTMLGAGMLALPLVSVKMGFGLAALTLIGMWAVMTYTGLIMLEVCLAFPRGSQFASIARALLGRRGALVINVTTMLLLFSLSASYISGASSTFQFDLMHYFGLGVPTWLVSVCYTALIALAIFAGASVVDKMNRAFFVLNILVIAVLMLFVDPAVHLEYLAQRPGLVYAWAALPIFMTAFGFHTTIPTVVNYLGGVKAPWTMRRIFVIGSLIPLIVYLAWMFASLGTLPATGPVSFQAVEAKGNSVGVFLSAVSSFVHAKFVPHLFNIFSSVVLITSYLCVALPLFEVIGASFKNSTGQPTLWRRLLLVGLCFVPPLAVALFYPSAFIMMLGLAAIFCCIICIIFPVVALYLLKRRGAKKLGLKNPSYKIFFGFGIYVLVVGFGTVMIVLQILSALNELPT